MPREGGARLQAVLFTDIVGSTDIAAKLGDERWSELLRRQRALVRRQLRRFGGREVDTAGDGLFAVFDRPAEAIRCAFAATADVQALGVDIRSGIHFGECEFADGQVHGIVVHTGARIMSMAEPARVLISGTVRDLVAGAPLSLHETGTFDLKGVPGRWTLYDVITIDGERRREPVPEAVAEERLSVIRALKRSRRPLVIGAASIVVVGLVTAVLVRPHEKPKPPPRVTGPENALVRLDVNTGRWTVVASGLGSDPPKNTGLVLGEGSVWVRGSFLRGVDPATGAVKQSDYSVSIENQGPVVVADHAIWVSGSNQLVRIDPGTAQTFGRPIPLTSSPTTFPWTVTDLAYGAGRIWASIAGGHVVAVDPVTLDTHIIAIDADPDEIAFGGGAVWALDSTGAVVVRIDPNTLSRTSIQLGGTPIAIAADADGVWIVDSQSGVLHLLDPSKGDPKQTYPVGANPFRVAIGRGVIWIASASGAITRVDPSFGTTKVVARLSVPIDQIAYDDANDTLWIRTGAPG